MLKHSITGCSWTDDSLSYYGNNPQLCLVDTRQVHQPIYLPDTTNAISVNFLSKDGIVYTQYQGLNYLNKEVYLILSLEKVFIKPNDITMFST